MINAVLSFILGLASTCIRATHTVNQGWRDLNQFDLYQDLNCDLNLPD